MFRANFMDWLSGALVTLGGINWGLMGFFNYNVVAHLFGDGAVATRVIYAIVGLAALWLVYFAVKLISYEQHQHMPV